MKDMGAEPIRRRGLLRLLLAAAGAGVIARVAAALEVGEPAPDFTLPATTGEKITLSQFRGKKLVLVEFYVADFAPT
jgi:cytochrome oxidase Cu insertion factor (SCO1/SenC/PrrC family)